MCKNHFWHKKDDDITAKVWLIGRSYAVAIERGRDNNKTTAKFYEKDIPLIFKKTNEENER